MSVKKELTDADIKKYCAEEGTKCPYCGCPDLEGYEINVEGKYAFQEMGCCNCDASWSDVRVLVGLNPIEPPDVDESEYEAADAEQADAEVETEDSTPQVIDDERYLVTWEIDMDGDSPEEAACKALIVQRDNDPANAANFFTVKDKQTGEVTNVDLSESQPCLKN